MVRIHPQQKLMHRTVEPGTDSFPKIGISLKMGGSLSVFLEGVNTMGPPKATFLEGFFNGKYPGFGG